MKCSNKKADPKPYADCLEEAPWPKGAIVEARAPRD